jgi:cyanophycinase-like exopeptidase
MVFKILVSIFISASFAIGQSYDYYFIGDTVDVQKQPSFGVCMMGGATEDDNGAAWFLNRADSGNVVVIRASGSDGYNSYFYNDLGVDLQSVETIVFNDASAAEDPFIIRRLENAEAIWIAGGDQYIYEQYWKNSSIMDILNNHINVKQAPIGGTSAGMAILGQYYFNAEVTSVTSNEALSDPYDAGVTIESDFLDVPFLENTITDTHYDNPDRKGRHSVFVARVMETIQGRSFGIAAEEYVAICIDDSGVATIFGEYPDFDDKAYFIQVNCRNETPEVLEQNLPLTWQTTNQDALIVYEVEARSDGSSKFDLIDWESGQNGQWKYWTIDQGVLDDQNGTAPNCNLGTAIKDLTFKVLPNPADDFIVIQTDHKIELFEVFDSSGKLVFTKENKNSFSVQNMENGVYYLKVQFNQKVIHSKFVVSH